MRYHPPLNEGHSSMPDDELKRIIERAEMIRDKLVEATQTGRVNLVDRAKVMAELMHELGCYRNHTDGCPWSYELEAPDPWLKREHVKWLRIACSFTGVGFPAFIDRRIQEETRRMEAMDNAR